ncbi:hypothetical protein GQ43DRAFT_492713 [Delitschia confertaspora ATCC 74209]|uniref:lytic cellulose monooxygenase (C4-dehydrogenating) n=1 Tax=Delitschia confertaspora ATCC 74209 TaxID=1513339 RepID=A0A9P4MWD1_9PLEO|nr:hypothetical protein GQ43DRAFT_492713 [Delitschia confertaspora ATCC 74209]
MPTIHAVVFMRLALNDHWFTPLQYIRNRTTTYLDIFNSTVYYDDSTTKLEGFKREYADPTYPQDSAESLRCGRDNMRWAGRTETLTVKGGDRISWGSVILPPRYWSEGMFAEGCAGVCGSTGPFHGGPVQAYLSRVPNGTDIREYDGSGRWFKISSIGLNPKSNLVDWLGSSLTHKESTNPTITIPAKTPPGIYLLRIEMTYPRALPNYAQFYTSCAHINVEGVGGGRLPVGVKVPKDFPWDHPGLSISKTMEDLKKVDTGYVYPGGELWDGN